MPPILSLLGGLLFLLLSSQVSEGKIVHGYLRTGDTWSFMSRFCFLSRHGKFQYEIQYQEDFGVQNIDLYYDTPEQWARVYGSKSDLGTCREKESVLQIENNQFVNLTTEMAASGCTRHVFNTTLSGSNPIPMIRCKGTRNFNTARERWWFVAVSNCLSTKGLQMSYRLLLTNGEKGDLLHYHFSADEFYILPILLVAFVQEFVLFCLAIWSAVVLRNRQLLHATYKLFLLTVFLHTLGVFLMATHYTIYALDGIGMETLKLYGRVLEASASIVFLLLVILIAKGYTVTRARLRQASAVKVTVFICCYCITFATLFIFEYRYFDPGEVLYTYESIAGYGLVALSTFGWCMFIYSTFFTLKHYPEKGGFYYPFFCFYTLYFVAGPCIIVIANHIIAQWVRQKVVVSVEHFVAFLGHLVFLLLTRPNAHNENFPYHVRTTQIGIMEAMASAAANGNASALALGLPPSNNANGGLGPNTLDAFGHGGTYGVTQHATAMDIFTVDSVARGGSRRPPTAPPAYSWAANGEQPLNGSALARGRGRQNGQPAGDAADAEEGSAGSPAVNGGPALPAKIYDPNDDQEEDNAQI